MDQKQVIKVLNEMTGRKIPVSPMYEKIQEWRAWLEGDVKGFHEYRQSTDLVTPKYTKIRRHKTNMLLRGSEDWASILLNEKTRIELDDANTELWLLGENKNSGIFGQFDFSRNANELIATSRWSGTAAFEVFVKEMKVTQDTGVLLDGKDIGMNFLCADQIIPISHDNGILREVAFISDQVDGDKTYQKVSLHTLDPNQLYTITSFTLDEDGKVIGDVNSVHTQCPYPWFSLIRKSGVNIHDYGSPFGVSIIDGNEDVLKGLDAAFDNFIVDFVLGRKQVFMNTTMFAHDTEGNAIAPQMSGANLFINVGDKLKDEKDLIHEFNPSLRVEENSTGVQKMLDLFSFKIGLGMKHYQFEGGVIQTATEYTGSKQDLVQNAAKEMIGIKSALTQIVRAVLWIGKNVLKAPIDADTNITVHSDDSYIIDQETERKRWREEIAMGIRSRVEYRMHFYGESEEEAIKAVEAAQGNTDLFAE